MNNSNYNIHTASGIAQDKKVRVRALIGKTRSKSKPHFSPQSERNWKPIIAICYALGRKMGAANSICT